MLSYMHLFTDGWVSVHFMHLMLVSVLTKSTYIHRTLSITASDFYSSDTAPEVKSLLLAPPVIPSGLCFTTKLSPQFRCRSAIPTTCCRIYSSSPLWWLFIILSWPSPHLDRWHRVLVFATVGYTGSWFQFSVRMP